MRCEPPVCGARHGSSGGLDTHLAQGRSIRKSRGHAGPDCSPARGVNEGTSHRSASGNECGSQDAARDRPGLRRLGGATHSGKRERNQREEANSETTHRDPRRQHRTATAASPRPSPPPSLPPSTTSPLPSPAASSPASSRSPRAPTTRPPNLGVSEGDWSAADSETGR